MPSEQRRLRQPRTRGRGPGRPLAGPATASGGGRGGPPVPRWERAHRRGPGPRGHAALQPSSWPGSSGGARQGGRWSHGPVDGGRAGCRFRPMGRARPQPAPGSTAAPRLGGSPRAKARNPRARPDIRMMLRHPSGSHWILPALPPRSPVGCPPRFRHDSVTGTARQASPGTPIILAACQRRAPIAAPHTRRPGRQAPGICASDGVFPACPAGRPPGLSSRGRVRG